jgi:hypothetical protein
MSRFDVDAMSEQNPYLASFRVWLDRFEPNLWERLEEIESFREETRFAVLIGALERACLAQHIGNINLGRFVLQHRLPREWVLQNIGTAAETILADQEQEWVFRRLLELYSTLDAGLLRELVDRGQRHASPDVRAAAQEFGRSDSSA